MQSEGNPISPLQRATSNLEYSSPSITASSLSWQTHPGFSPRSPEAVLRLCFPWQLSFLHLLWEEERWVPFVFSGHISIRWWPVSTLLHTLTSWSTHIFNPAHFLETQGSQRLQETHTGLVHSYTRASTKPKKDLFPEKMESFSSGAQRPAYGLQCTVMRRSERQDRWRRRRKGREGRKPGRGGGRELISNIDLFHERAVLHSESMFALSFCRSC